MVKWDDQFATVEDHDKHLNEWAQGLADLNAAEITKGIDYCRNNLSWPPNVADFREAALRAWDEYEEDWKHKSGAYKMFEPEKPIAIEQKANPEFVENQIKEMRKMLKMKITD